MIDKRINSITEDDLQELVTNAVSEGPRLEYKGALNIDTAGQKKEFLADVSSFANTRGGDLVIGISEAKATGCPEAVCGIEADSLDQLVQRVESVVRNGISPTMRFTSQPIRLQSGHAALVLRIPESSFKPHRVETSGRFFARNTNGKYPMDVQELREAFALSETFAERIRAFRLDRLDHLSSGDTPVPLNGKYLVVMHVVPTNSLRSSRVVDLERARNDLRMLPLLESTPTGSRFTFDGLVAFDQVDGSSSAYTLAHRNGVIESVYTRGLGTVRMGVDLKNRPRDRFCIRPRSIEGSVIRTLPQLVATSCAFQVGMPLWVMISLVNCRNAVMYVAEDQSSAGMARVDRDTLPLPEILIEEEDFDADVLLKPAFDVLWNSCGLARSMNYNSEGRWRVTK